MRGWLVGTVLVGALALGTGSSSATAGQEAGGVAAGREVFAANCAMCHGEDASGMMGMHPSLRGAVQRLTHEGVEVTIRRGRETSPPMPAFEDRLTEQQIDHVIAYLESLPAGPRNFGPDAGTGGMGGMMMGGRDGAPWLVVVGLTGLVALLLGLALGYRMGRRPHDGGGW